MSDTLEKIAAAKAAHQQWVENAERLVNGDASAADKTPVLHTSCAFGKWYYHDGQTLGALQEFACIEHPHEELHRIYMEIFSLASAESDPFAEAPAEDNSARLNELLQQLKNISGQLIHCLDLLERKIG